MMEIISVSYRSYILTYFKTIVPMKKILNFRLLSELYSHLFFLLKYFDKLQPNNQFPSPIGVIFSLIPILKKTFVCNSL